MKKHKNTTTNTSPAVQAENTSTKNVTVRTGVKAGYGVYDDPGSASPSGEVSGESWIFPNVA